MVGIVAVMRKLLVNTWVMHRNGTVWDPTQATPRTKEIKNAALAPTEHLAVNQ
ncbi:MAG: hypothetical protein ACI9MR_003101 [Myxococcota bacterium]|jgi:hypothetical protein